MLFLHTPGIGAEYLRAAAQAIDGDPCFLEYEADGDLDGWVAQAEALRARSGVSSWAVFGHGLGGFVAQAYAAAHPARVEKLVLCGTAPSLAWLGPKLTELQRAVATRVGSDAHFKQLCLEVLPLAFASASGVPAGLRELFDALTFDRRLFVNALAAARAVEPAAVKTLIIHGRHDRLMWVEPCGHGLLDRLDEAELLVFERSGHFPFLEQPGAFVIAVDAFLRPQAEDRPLLT